MFVVSEKPRTNGTLYHTDMGDNIGSSARFRNDGSVHQTVYDRDGGGRYSWDQRADGSVDNLHFTDQDGRGEQQRHPFGRD